MHNQTTQTQVEPHQKGGAVADPHAVEPTVPSEGANGTQSAWHDAQNSEESTHGLASEQGAGPESSAGTASQRLEQQPGSYSAVAGSAARTPRSQPPRRTGTKAAGVVGVVAASLLAGYAGGTAAVNRSQEGDGVSSKVTVVQHSSPVAAGVDWVAEVADTVQPSVVGIRVLGIDGTAGSGSGVAFTPDGYILTNAHVVDEAEEIIVRLDEGVSVPARLVGADPLYDIAVISIDREIPAAVFNTQPASVGEPVAAFGSPLGLYGTVTVGIVSAVARPVTAGNGQGETSIVSAVQTDAAINPGNSGGPLVNAGGEVIGVNSSIATLSGDRGGSIGLGFAIPAKTAVRVATELINNGAASRPLIGVTVGPTDSGGARIENVTDGSPAQAAGIESGDIVIAVDGVPVDSPVAAIALIRDTTPGQPISITLDRDGYELTVTVTTTSDTVQAQTATVAPTPVSPSSSTPNVSPSGLPSLVPSAQPSSLPSAPPGAPSSGAISPPVQQPQESTTP